MQFDLPGEPAAAHPPAAALQKKRRRRRRRQQDESELSELLNRMSTEAKLKKVQDLASAALSVERITFEAKPQLRRELSTPVSVSADTGSASPHKDKDLVRRRAVLFAKVVNNGELPRELLRSSVGGRRRGSRQ